MNCDFSDLKKQTINYKRVNLENLFFLLYLTGYRATGLPGYLLYPTVLSGLPTG